MTTLRDVYAETSNTKMPMSIGECQLPRAAICLVGSGMKMPKRDGGGLDDILDYIGRTYDILLKGERHDALNSPVFRTVSDMFTVRHLSVLDVRCDDAVKIITYSGVHDWDAYEVLAPLKWIYEGVSRNTLKLGDLLALVLDSQMLSSLAPSKDKVHAVSELIPKLMRMDELPPVTDVTGKKYPPGLAENDTVEMEVMGRLLPYLLQLCIPRIQAMRLIEQDNKQNTAKGVIRASLVRATFGEIFAYISFKTPGIVGMSNLYLYTRMMIVTHFTGILTRVRLTSDVPAAGHRCATCQSVFSVCVDVVSKTCHLQASRHVPVCNNSVRPTG